MLPENIETSLREAALRSFRDSLENATKKRVASDADVIEKQQALDLSIEQRDILAKDCKAFADLIEVYTIEDSEEDEGEEEDAEGLPNPNQARKRRGRLNARPKTLELIQQGRHFVTVDEVVDFVTGSYEEGAIKEKTIRNAVWDLTTSNELKKQYDKNLREYIYGLPEWFDKDIPKVEFLNEPNNVTPVNDSAHEEYEEVGDVPYILSTKTEEEEELPF